MRRALPWLLGFIIALGPAFLGCDEGKSNQMVVPEKPDVDRSKASIEYTQKRLAEEKAKRK